MEEDVTKTVIKTLKAYLHEELPPNKDFFNKLDCRDLLDSDTALELAQLADQGKKDCIWKLVTFMEQFYTEEKLLRLCIFLEEYAKPARPKLATISSRIRQEISKQKQVSLAVPEDTIHRSARVYDDEEVLFPVITPLKQQFSELVSKVFGIISKLNEEEMEELHTYLTTLLTPSVGQGISDSVRLGARLPIVPKPVNELKEFLRLRWDVLHTQVLESIIKHLKNDKLTEMMAHYQQTLSKEANKSLSEHPAERAQTVFPLEETLVQFKLGRNLCELTLAHVSEFCRLICSWITEAVEFRGYKCGCTVLFFSIPTECVRSLPSCLLPSSLSLLEEWKVLFFSVKGAFTVDIKKERHFIDSLDKGKIGELELTVSTLNEELDIAKLDLKEARIMWDSETAGELRSAKLDILKMSQTLTEQQDEIAQLEQTVSTLEEELDTTKVQVEEDRIKDSETAEELRLAKLDNTRMSQTLTERQDKISQLDRVNSTLNEELDTVKLDLKEARIMWDSETAGELRSAKLDNTRMSQTLTERQDEIAQLEQTVSTLKEELDTTKVQVEEARIKDSETAEELRLAKLKMSQTLTERLYKISQLDRVISTLNEKLDTVKLELKEARIMWDSETAGELRSAKLDNTRMSQTLTERQDEIAQLEQTVSTLKEELDTTKVQAEEARIKKDSETAEELRLAKLDNTRMSQTLTELQDEIALTVSNLNEKLDTTKLELQSRIKLDSKTARELRPAKLDNKRISQTSNELQDEIAHLERTVSTIHEELDTANLKIRAKAEREFNLNRELKSVKEKSLETGILLAELQEQNRLLQTQVQLNQADFKQERADRISVTQRFNFDKEQLTRSVEQLRSRLKSHESKPGHDDFRSLKSINSVVTERNESLLSEVRQLHMSLFDHQQQIACLEENKKRAEEDKRRAVAMMQRTGEEKQKAEEKCKEYKRYKDKLSAQVGQKMLVGEELMSVKSELKQRDQDYEEKCQELKKCHDDLGAKAAQYTFLEQELAEIKRQSRKR